MVHAIIDFGDGPFIGENLLTTYFNCPNNGHYHRDVYFQILRYNPSAFSILTLLTLVLFQINFNSSMLFKSPPVLLYCLYMAS